MRVEREDTVFRAGSVKDPVHDKRCGFELPGCACLIDPLHHQGVDGRGVDLIERTEAMASVIPRIGKPVLRFLCRIYDPDESNLCASIDGHNTHSEQNQTGTPQFGEAGNPHFVPTLSR